MKLSKQIDGGDLLFIAQSRHEQRKLDAVFKERCLKNPNAARYREGDYEVLDTSMTKKETEKEGE